MKDLLRVENLTVEFGVHEGILRAVDNVSFSIPPGGTLALVGESGSGKSVCSQAIMGLLPRTATIPSGSILFDDPRDKQAGRSTSPSSTAPARRCAHIRGGAISIIFQEPMTSLSALHTVGDQIGEAVELHGGGGQLSNIHSLGDQINEAAEQLAAAHEPRRDRRADHRHAAHGGLPRSQAGAAHLSVRAVGRPAPARHDRHGAGLPAGAADRRRADHRARRHHPGPDPAPHEGPAEGARHGAADDHPRSRRGRQRRRRRGRDVSRQGGRIGRPARHLPRPAASLSQGAAARRAALRHGARRAAGSRSARSRRRPAICCKQKPSLRRRRPSIPRRRC